MTFSVDADAKSHVFAEFTFGTFGSLFECFESECSCTFGFRMRAIVLAAFTFIVFT